MIEKSVSDWAIVVSGKMLFYYFSNIGLIISYIGSKLTTSTVVVSKFIYSFNILKITEDIYDLSNVDSKLHLLGILI